MIFIFSILFLIQISSSRIINEYALKCKDCINYVEQYSKCKVFYIKINDNIIYDDALSCRLNVHKCGENGYFYRRKKQINKNITKN